jgi:hypothetical protein
MKAEKIHLKTFISTLVDLYNRGVDYIDLQKQENEEGDSSLVIYFSKEYMNDDIVDGRNNSSMKDDDLKDLTA